MKKFISILSISVFAIVLIAGVAQADTSSHLLGRILLQVEEHGEAWYVLPETAERIYLADGEVAYAVMSAFGVGITTADLEKIPMGINEQFIVADTDGDGLDDYLEELLGTGIDNVDTDGDGYLDGEEVANGYEPMASGGVKFAIDESFAESMKGKILLQVERKGEAWYVSPDDGKRYYMRDGDAAYEIMRYLSLGITNMDLSMVAEYDSRIDCGSSYNCYLAALEAELDVEIQVQTNIDFMGYGLVTNSILSNDILSEQGGAYEARYMSYTLNQTFDGEVQEEMSGATIDCSYEDKQAMIDAIADFSLGNFGTSSLDFAECETYMVESVESVDCGEDLSCFSSSVSEGNQTTVLVYRQEDGDAFRWYASMDTVSQWTYYPAHVTGRSGDILATSELVEQMISYSYNGEDKESSSVLVCPQETDEHVLAYVESQLATGAGFNESVHHSECYYE